MFNCSSILDYSYDTILCLYKLLGVLSSISLSRRRRMYRAPLATHFSSASLADGCFSKVSLFEHQLLRLNLTRCSFSCSLRTAQSHGHVELIHLVLFVLRACQPFLRFLLKGILRPCLDLSLDCMASSECRLAVFVVYILRENPPPRFVRTRLPQSAINCMQIDRRVTA